MTSSPLIESLSRLVAEKPGLVAALQAVDSIEKAVEILAKAGAENGVAVDKAALAAHLAEQVKRADARLSEADLDQVAGGGIGGAIATSIVTLGVGCAMGSLVSAIGGRDCGKTLTSF